jgi:hypothetical protein
MSHHIAVAATAAYPDMREDWPILQAALADVGIAATAAVWTDPSIDWADFDLVLATCVWDYIHRQDEFIGWTEHVAARTLLCNPPAVLQWNADKHYLAELADAGIPTIPTTFLDVGQIPGDLPVTEFVIKPTISGGAFQSARYGTSAEEQAAARTHIAHLHPAGRAAMVQPYQPSVDGAGESGLIYLGGTYSHAIHKAALLQPGVGPTEGLAAQMVITPSEASTAQRDLATRILEYTEDRFGPLTYARVDLIADQSGLPMLMELEVLDPALFFEHEPAAAVRFAEVLATLLG